MKKIVFLVLICNQAWGMEAPPSRPTERDVKLVETVEAGKLDEVELLLLSGANPNIQVRLWGFGPFLSALEAATRVPDIRMYRLIKSNGGNPGAVDSILIHVLEQVSVFADPQQQKKYDEMKQSVIEDLIADPRTNLNVFSASQNNPLIWFVKQKNIPRINSLLATGRVNVNAETEGGLTAYDFAKTKTIKNLLEAAGGHAGSRKRKVPAAAKPTVATPVEKPATVLPKGQKRKESEPWQAFTAEPFKAQRQESPVLKPINFIDAIIHAIVLNDIPAALHYLISGQGQFDINKEGSSVLGERILDVALQRNALPVVQRLMQMPELKVNYTDKYGNTPLLTATKRSSPEIVAELLKRKDLLINEVSLAGTTALDYAFLNPNASEVSNLLRAHGAKTGLELRGGPQPQPQFRPAPRETTRFDAAIYAKLGLAQTATPYQILGIPSDANAEKIKAAFKVRTREWHPDKNPDPMAKDVIQLINWAYKQIEPK